ncbi:MAG TPA: thioesterase family protein [Thermoanaerobaculia bacterium]|jgi:YbgC/YbaW family acyl-CoA thioester hydrolase|nr:thioesterase family protein [Thermoanaerobaculia bacterium]
MHEIRFRRRVEFVDTDMSGIMHFSRYLVFMENAEHAFLEALGTRVQWREGEREMTFPRVAVACEYLSPSRFGDELEVHLKVLRKGTKSLTYGFEITRGGTAVSRGRTTCACCELGGPDKGLRSVPIPAWIAERIEEAPPGEG